MNLRGRILYVVTLDECEAAITWQVAQLSKAWQTPVVLLGVQPGAWFRFLTDDRRRELKRRLLEVARRLRGLKGHVAGIKASTGDLCTEARRFADQIGAELIMIGAGARAALDPLAISAAPFELARRARQDVWICKPDADPNIEHVLCAADTSALAGDAVRRSVDLCRRFNARLRLLSVLPEPAREADPDETARRGREQQRAFLDQFDLAGVPLSRAIVWGAETQVEVLLEAERFADGLLVMGATSHWGANGLGATAAPVLRACPSSILIVRRRGGEAREAAAGTAVAIDSIADGERGAQWAPTSPPSR